LSIRIERDVYDVTVLGFAFGADIVFELLDPSVAFFPVKLLVMSPEEVEWKLTLKDRTYFSVARIDWPG
jgi:hypothetical protein